MKRISVVLLLISAGFVNAQAYKGKGDIKVQVGLNSQTGGTGIHALPILVWVKICHTDFRVLIY